MSSDGKEGERHFVGSGGRKRAFFLAETNVLGKGGGTGAEVIIQGGGRKRKIILRLSETLISCLRLRKRRKMGGRGNLPGASGKEERQTDFC